MNEAICSEIRKRYNLQIGTRTGKRLKIAMGRLNDQRREARKVVGIDGISGLPREEIISGYVVNAGIMNCVNEIAAEMKTFLERSGSIFPVRRFLRRAPVGIRRLPITVVFLRKVHADCESIHVGFGRWHQ